MYRSPSPLSSCVSYCFTGILHRAVLPMAASALHPFAAGILDTASTLIMHAGEPVGHTTVVHITIIIADAVSAYDAALARSNWQLGSSTDSSTEAVERFSISISLLQRPVSSHMPLQTAATTFQAPMTMEPILPMEAALVHQDFCAHVPSNPDMVQRSSQVHHGLSPTLSATYIQPLIWAQQDYSPLRHANEVRGCFSKQRTCSNRQMRSPGSTCSSA